MGRLENRVALITGAARGQGRSHALCFAEEGARSRAPRRSWGGPPGRRLGSTEAPISFETTARRCRELGSRVVTVLCDVRDHEGVEGAVGSAVEELGKVDVLINDAGVTSPTGAGRELPVEGWRFVMGINLDGAWHVGRAVARQMIAGGEGGAIINISVGRGPQGFPEQCRLRRVQARSYRLDPRHGG